MSSTRFLTGITTSGTPHLGNYVGSIRPSVPPFLYTQIAFATLAGWLVFDHAPDALAWVGIAVIAASGVGNALLSAREQAKTRAAATRAAL